MSQPNMKNIKFRYCQLGSLDPGTGTFASTSVRVTSLFDVDYTGTGTVPPRFVQYALFYQKHMVRKCRIKVHFLHNSTTGPGSVVGVQLNEGSSAASDIPSMVCDPRTRYKVIGNIYAGVHTVTHEYDPVSFFGVKPGALAALDEINVSTGANPSDNIFFTIHTAGWNIAANAEAVQYLLEMEFLVDFKDPKLVVQA